MPTTVPIAHDFTCPWCWAGLIQAKRLKEEYGVQLEWRAFELMPEALPWPEPTPEVPKPANRPPTLSRLQFLLEADGIQLPKSVRPGQMRTHQAHEAVEYAKAVGADVDKFVEVLYRAYWEDGEAIDELDYLTRVAHQFGFDLVDFSEAVESRRFAERIVPFDDESYAIGVYNVPTFTIGGEPYAEQPYSVLSRAMGEAKPYLSLSFPPAPAERPYVFVNMVATVDGKILSGDPEDGQVDLGSREDRAAMRRIEAHADAILIGATTLRHTSPNWVPGTPHRIVVSRSGDVDPRHGFFHGGQGWLASGAGAKVPDGLGHLQTGDPELDLPAMFAQLRELGIARLLVLGGSELNAQLLEQDIVDELFLTVAPKIKLGRDIPTLAGGSALPSDRLLGLNLISQQKLGDEFFLRYRRSR